MSAYFTAAGVAIICLVLAIVLWKHPDVDPIKTVALLAMLAAFGISGLVGTALAKASAKGGEMLSTGSAKLFGVGVLAALLIGLTAWLFLEFRPKNKRPFRSLPAFAFLFPFVVAMVGGGFAGIGGLGNDALTKIGEGLSSMAMMLGG